MKKKILLGISIVVLMAVVVYAAEHLGDYINSYHSVDNPHMMLFDNNNYAIFTDINFTSCPDGDFSDVNGTCYEDDSGEIVKAWAIIEFNSTNETIFAYSLITRSISTDGGCSGDGCNKSTKLNVFIADTIAPQDWDFIGTISMDPDETMNTTFSLGVNGTGAYVKQVLIGSKSIDRRPDAGVYVVKLFD